MYYSGSYVNRVLKKSRKKRGGWVKRIGNKLAGFFIVCMIALLFIVELWVILEMVIAIDILVL